MRTLLSHPMQVVGVRYYTGYANLNEMVQLIREPDNAYDRW